MKIQDHFKKTLITLPFILLTPIASADWGITLGADNEGKRYKNYSIQEIQI